MSQGVVRACGLPWVVKVETGTPGYNVAVIWSMVLASRLCPDWYARDGKTGANMQLVIHHTRKSNGKKGEKTVCGGLLRKQCVGRHTSMARPARGLDVTEIPSDRG